MIFPRKSYIIYNMYRTLRIIFCILAVLIAAAAIFIFVYLGWQWGLVAVLGVAVCAALMLKCCRKSRKERKTLPRRRATL